MPGSTFAGNFAIEAGGGIANSGTLTVTRSTFTENEGFGTGGGGIANFGQATVRRSTFEGNIARNPGAGIFNLFGTLTVEGSIFTENDSSGNTLFGNFGGGLANFGAATLTKSTLEGNIADLGGGVFNAGLLTPDLTTITHNRAGAGGGIYLCREGESIGIFSVRVTAP